MTFIGIPVVLTGDSFVILSAAKDLIAIANRMPFEAS
jgi:hypothetical protein